MSTEPTTKTTQSSTQSPVSKETIPTEPIGALTISLPNEWSVDEPKYPNKNAICTLYGYAGTRIDLLEVSFASNDTEAGVLAKLYIADPPYSPAYEETSTIIVDAGNADEKLATLFEAAPSPETA